MNGNPAGAMAVLGIECSTFVSINRGTSWRDELNPWGNPGAPSVQAANMSTSRQGCGTACFCALHACSLKPWRFGGAC